MSEIPPVQLLDETRDAGAATTGYVPGACNIGPAEIKARMRGGHASAAATVAVLGGLLAIRAPAPARLIVAIPAAGAASGYLQARFHFCAAFGSRGLYNFGALGDEVRIADRAARAADRRTSIRIGLASLAIGLSVGLAAALLPLGTRPRPRA